MTCIKFIPNHSYNPSCHYYNFSVLCIMKPEVWGPSAWLFLHTITLAYPSNPTFADKNNYKMFFNNLSNVLPCELCKSHYKQHIQHIPLTDEILSSKYKLTKWLVDIHNHVNQQTGKKEVSYDSFLNKYYKLYNSNSYTYIIYAVVVILIIQVLFIYFR